MLSHIMEDGSEKPVAYACHTLRIGIQSTIKRPRPLPLGSKRFHQYLYEREFSTGSAHKPLQYVLSESQAVPIMASERLQCRALLLSAYQPGETLANANGLNRLPIPETLSKVMVPAKVILPLQTLQWPPITAKHIKRQTDKDPILSRVRNFILKCWNTCEDK